MDLDAIVRQAVIDSQVAYGEKIAPGARPLISQNTNHSYRGRAWTPDEEAYYTANAGRLTLEEIGAHLGRSVGAIKCHYFRKGLHSPSRQPGYLTTNKIGLILGIDSHKPSSWVKAGVLPGEQIASPVGWSFHRVSWVRFKMWLVNPKSWIYFDARKIKNPSLRSLVLRAQSRWGDEWWSARMAADYLHVDVGTFHHRVYHGTLYGIQAKYLGGRDASSWSLWYFRKSDILVLHIFRGKGSDVYPWPPRADAFLLRARAQGWTFEHIARAMKWSIKRAAYRYHQLQPMQAPADPPDHPWKYSVLPRDLPNLPERTPS